MNILLWHPETASGSAISYSTTPEYFRQRRRQQVFKGLEDRVCHSSDSSEGSQALPGVCSVSCTEAACSIAWLLKHRTEMYCNPLEMEAVGLFNTHSKDCLKPLLWSRDWITAASRAGM